MLKIRHLIFAGLLAACALPAPQGLPEGAIAAVAADVVEPRLLAIDLPAGDVNGIDIDFQGGTGRTKYQSSTWLSLGYDGVVFRGQGVGVTHLRPRGDQTVLVDRHDGIVRFENLTLHCGPRQGIWFGLEHKDSPVKPKFKLDLQYVHVLADPPPVGAQHSTVWALFGYQSDVTLRDVTIDARYSAEHASYWHHFAKDGLRWERVKVIASGAEQCKVRNSPTEGVWIPTAKVVVTASQFGDWYQPWTWRGGGGIVMQGAGCDVIVTGCSFRAGGAIGGIPASSRTRAVMIDNAGGDHFSALDGQVGVGFGTGHVLIRNCGFQAGPGTENLSVVIRVGALGGASKVAKSVRIENCAIYGERLQLQLSDVPPGKLSVKGCNSEWLREFAAAFGFDVAHEALLPLSGRVANVSEGLVR